MLRRRVVCEGLAVLLAVAGLAVAESGAASAQAQAAAAKHAFSPKDWAALRSAGAVAVSADGTILYIVSFGGDRGPTRREWWTAASDGSHAAKLELPEGFMLGRGISSMALEESSVGWELRMFSVRVGWNSRSTLDAIALLP